MQGKLIFSICALISSVVLIGCQDFSVAVNEKQVYSPPSLFSNYQLVDEKLNNCVTQTIYDQHIVEAEQLTRLNCSNAGIHSLAGLGKFHAIKELNLADNALTTIDDLALLSKLNLLILSNNHIKNAAPLLRLMHLKELKIDGNDEANCNDLHQVIANFDIKIKIRLPHQCEH